ncbi:MAG: AAA family ATPase [Candidatus Glassbacteria bacterium]|nr:AAA family ATPase [Candidatus Glassbacteria bacterium]
MRTTVFTKTSNVERFLAGITEVEKRGAAEACLMLVEGKPGLGKTMVARWWAVQQGAVYLRAKTTWTPNRALANLITELGGSASGYRSDLFNDALTLMARDETPPAVVLDEVEHTLHDSKVLETFRDLSDLLEFPLVLIGMEGIGRRLDRHEQISSRIARRVKFEPATLEDTALCVKEKAEVAMAEDLVAELHRLSKGKIRSVLNGIALVENIARRNGWKEVKLADLRGLELIHDWRAMRPGLVNRNGKK